MKLANEGRNKHIKNYTELYWQSDIIKLKEKQIILRSCNFMKTNVNKTMENIKTFLETKSGHNYFAEMFGPRKGFISQAMTHDRVFWIMYRVEENIGEVVIEIYPEINCSAAYRAQTADFIMQKNAEKRISNIRIDDCGSIHLHIEHGIKDEAASIETIELMEHIGMQTLISSIEEIDCIAHGRLYINKPNAGRMDLLKALSSGMDLDGIVGKGIRSNEDDAESDSKDEKKAMIGALDGLLSALAGGINSDDENEDDENDSAIA